MKKRLLSAFLAVMMVLTMAPVAFAADGGEAVAQQGTSVSLPTDNKGDLIISDDGAVLDGTKEIYTNGTITVNAANVTIKNLTFGDKAKLVVNTSGKFTLTGCTFAPDTNNTQTGFIRTAVNLNVGEAEVTDNTFEGVTNGYYNAIEFGIGSDNNDLKAATISGNTFKSAIVNNYFNFYNMTDGAQINIVNNKLLLAAKSSNGIRISNFRNATGVTFNIDSDEYTYAADSADRQYEGLILLEDYSEGSDVQNFSGITINVTNLSAPKSAKRLLYVYDDQDGIITTNQPKLTGDDSLAQFYAAKIGNTYYKSLVDAYAALPRGEGAAPSAPTTITLLKDSEGGGIGSDKTDSYMNYVIDFNGHTYTVGAPAVGSTGTVSQGIRVLQTSTAKFMNGTLKAANYKDLIQVVHTYGDVTFQDFTVDATEDAYAWAAVEPDAGTLKVLGNSSILARKGQYGLYAAFWHVGSYDGTTVDVDTTGKITGKLAYEFDEDYTGENKATENKGFVNIKNGNFDILSIQEIWSDVSDEVDKNVGGIIISGGYFTVDPTEYLANGYVAATSDKSGYDYMVTKKTDTGSITVKPAVADPEVKVDKIPQEAQATVKAAAETVSAPTLGAAAVDEAQKINEDKATELVNSATKVTGDKKLYVQSSLKVEPTAYDAANKTLALEITPQYRVVASTATTADEIKLDGNKNAQVVQDYQPMNITKATVVTMELPDGFAVAGDKLSIKHTKSNGTVEYYTGTVTEQSGKHLLTFTTNGFSPFVISVPAASIGENVYPTLQAAVDSVKSGKTIKLEQAVAADTKVTVAKSINFKVDTNGKTFNAAKNIVAGSNTTVKVTGESSPYTYEFTYTKPSSGGSSGGSSSGKTTYKVTTSAVNNGGVNASPSSAEKGAAITITLSPDKGYKLDKLTVTDGSGKAVSTVKKSDTVYTFTMPASAVKVGVSYVKATETPSETKFNDVSANDWFASAVDYVTGKGMMNGTADNTFSPKANTTRGMVVTVLYRLENQPSTSAASFTDVASGAYYANAVAWANANGIVSGYGSGKFGPNDKVTREQLAAILYRYAQYKKYDVSVGEDTNILSYDDAQSISTYAIPAIQWACGAGVVTGKSGSKLDPKGNATRAEVAAMLMRFCENVK